MKKNILNHPMHLGLGAKVFAEPEFTGMEWYADYGARRAKDGKEGRLVSVYSFSEPWDSWEMHPNGEEAVICLEGEITLIQEIDGKPKKTRLSAFEYAVNPAGVWHTADVKDEATAMFITSGIGTQHRPRD
jgi:hypothetical protein